VAETEGNDMTVIAMLQTSGVVALLIQILPIAAIVLVLYF
jgi:hypothetical protein